MPVMRSPQGEERTVPQHAVAAMQAMGWTDRGPAAGEQQGKRRPGRPRKTETEPAESRNTGEDAEP